MKEYAIDDLLAIVDRSLLANYERRHLNGETLYNMNLEYGMIAEAPSKVLLKWTNLWTFAMLTGSLWFFLAMLYVTPWYAVIVILALCSPMTLYFLGPVRARLLRDSSTLCKSNPILQHFRAAVEGLDPTGMTKGYYTQTSVREVLVILAVRVLEAESKFDVLRLQKERRTSDVIGAGRRLYDSQVLLGNTLDWAEQFGMEFSKSSLFADAQKHIEHTNRLLAEKNT